MYLKVFGDAIPSGLSTEQIEQFYQLAKLFKDTDSTTTASAKS